MRLSLDEKNLNHYWLNRPWMTKMKFCYYNIPKFTLTDTLVSLRWLEKSSKELMSRASNFEIAQKIELFSLSLISARNIHHVSKLWDGSKFEEKLEEPSQSYTHVTIPPPMTFWAISRTPCICLFWQILKTNSTEYDFYHAH